MAPEQAARLELSGQYAAGSTAAPQAQTTGAAPAIPDYELLRRVGRGAYGEVWLARNLTGSFVAVKVVARAAFEYDRPFEREFEGIKRTWACRRNCNSNGRPKPQPGTMSWRYARPIKHPIHYRSVALTHKDHCTYFLPGLKSRASLRLQSCK
jgi:serine/threonine protein kinase